MTYSAAWRKIPAWLLIVFTLALFLATPQNMVKAAPVNIIDNPGWELAHHPHDTYDRWLMGYRDDGAFGHPAHSGSYSMQLYSNYCYQPFNYTGLDAAINTDGISEISFWYCGFTGGNTYWEVDLYYNDTYGGATEKTWSNLVPANSVWTKVTLDISGLPANAWCTTIDFHAGTGNPIWYDDVTLLYEYTPPPPVYPFSIDEGGLLDGDADGSYVFVSPKQYTFYMDYQGNATAFQIAFNDDALANYSWYYNETSGLYYNISPGDGISGAFLSHSALNATHNRALWKLKFNLPVADSQNVTLYADIWDNYGNNSFFQRDDAFNIYNLGGYNTLTASGWAGRVYDVQTGITTGDGFEIFAADSRTPFMIDDQPFGDTGTFGLFQYKADPRKELPGWEFILTSGTDGYIELKSDHIAEGLPPYPLFTSQGVLGNPSSMHVFSSEVADYTPRASVQFRRKVSDETVNATFWVLAHDLNTYALFRLADNNLYTKGGFEASTFEIKGATMGFRNSTSDYQILHSLTADTWYKIRQSVNVPGDTQRVQIWDSSGVLHADSGIVGTYQTVAYLNYWNVIAQDSGAPGAKCDLYVDELQIKSDFSGDYGGIVKSSTIYHKLQLWRQDFDFSIEEGSEYTKAAYADDGYIELGLDYMVNGLWVNNGLWARVNVTSSNIMNKNNYVKYEINWFQDNELLRNDTLYGLFFGNSGADIGDSRKDATGFHWSIWFNRMNASTVMGGRLNTEYYGMSDKAAWWALFSSDWKPMLSDVDESTCYISIKDSYGNPTSAKSVSLVRCWERVYRNNESTFHYSIQNIREQNFQVAGNTMEGIDTPPIVKTMTPTMPGGFLGSALAAIFKGIIGRLGDGLLWGGLMVWSSFAGFIEVMAGYFGAQGWYTYVMSAIYNGMNTVTVASGYLLTVNAWIWSLLLYVFGWFTSIIYWLNLWVTMIWNTWGMLTGTYYGTTDFIGQFQLGQFAMLLLIMLPLLLIDRMSTRGVFPVLNELEYVWGWVQWGISYLVGLIDGFVNLVFRLIEAIPVIQ